MHQSEMLICSLRRHSALLSPVQKTRLYQIRLIRILNCDPLLADCRCYGLNSDRSSGKTLYYGLKYLAVKLIKSQIVNSQRIESRSCDFYINSSVTYYFTEDPYSLKKTVSNSRCSPRSSSELV